MFLENTLKYGKQFGWIEVVCGSMFSGKTEELIRRLKRAKFAKLKVAIFKPTSNGLEIWTYNHKGIIKSDRKVTFNDNNEIIENKKHLSPIAYIVKYVVVPIGVIGLATVTYFLTTDGSILIF